MKKMLSTYKGRMNIIPESEHEKDVIRSVCIGVNDKRMPWSISDCLLNHVALNRTLDIPLKFDLASQVAADREPDVRLLPYQKIDLEKTKYLPFVLNANPMGYGKTVEALQWAKARGYKKILVLCPKSVRFQWQTAFWEWFDVEAEVSVSPATLDAPIIITNYEQLLRRKFYADRIWDCVIADEVHRIRNCKSQSSVMARSIRASARIGLTGTPIMNQPDDLWGICLFINKNFLGESYWNFVDKYCKIVEDFWGKKISGPTEDPIKLNILKETMDLFWIRNPQNLVGQEVRQNIVELEMYPAQAKLYMSIRKLAMKELEEANIQIANAMVQVMDLQRMTTHPRSFESYTGKNIKFEWIQDLLEDNPELKICVFSKFKRAIIALQQELGAEACVTIHGDISAKDREVAKQRFINGPSIRVIAGTIGAMSEGIDGLQQCCHTVVFLDCAWNPEENNQAIARVARMGQQYNVNVFMLYCMHTIDRYVGKVALTKMEFIRDLIYREE